MEILSARVHFAEMAPPQHIPKPTIKRLSLYLREIDRRVEHGEQRTSSRQLGVALGLADTQVRKDLACFGQFGHPGVGYSTSELAARLRTILGKDHVWNVAIVGAGKIGQAIMGYGRFGEEGFNTIAVFDGNEKIVGSEISGHMVHSMSSLDDVIGKLDVRLGIVAVPEEVAQEVASRLVEAGVSGILNFAPIRLDVDAGVNVVNVDFTAAIEELAFKVSLGIKESFDEES